MVEKQSIPLDEREYYTAMSHFYRGELGRIMIWRQRLDTTSNWAVFSSTGIITFAFSHPEISHLVFTIGNFMLFLLLMIEGRRYRFYDAFRARVRMLEVHFLASAVLRRSDKPIDGWRDKLAQDLINPSFKISTVESIARRFRRNYIHIFGVILLAWVAKIYLSKPSVHTLPQFLQQAVDTQPLPGWLYWIVFFSFYIFLTGLFFFRGARTQRENELEWGLPQW